VVVVDMQVTFAAKLQVDARVFGKKFEHVVQEVDARLNVVAPFAIEIERDANIGLFCFAHIGGFALRSLFVWGFAVA
jgi:hypothetical protein